MVGYNFKDIKPGGDRAIEQKIKRSKNYADIILYLNLKNKETHSAVSVREVSKFFNLDDSYTFRVLRFFVDNDLLHRVKQTKPHSVLYVPNGKEITRYIGLAFKCSKGEVIK